MMTWNNIDSMAAELENKESELFQRDEPTYEEIDDEKHYQEYDIKSYFQYLQKDGNANSIVDRPYQLVKQLQLLEETKCYEIMRIINPKQAKMVKEIDNEKKNSNEPLHVLVTGSVGIRKAFIVIAISQSLIRLYNNMFEYNPPQLKGIITTYTGKVAFNVGGIMLHYAFHLPFNKLEYLFLKGEKLDTSAKCRLFLDFRHTS